MVGDGVDHLVHIVGLVGVVGDDLVEDLLLAADGVVASHARRLLTVVGGQVGQQRADVAHEVFLGLGREARHAALAGMDAGATEVLGVDILARDGLDDLRAGEKHIAGLLLHEDEVGEGRRIDRATGAGAEDGGDLGNDARGKDVALEDLAIARQGGDALLDACAPRIVHIELAKLLLQKPDVLLLDEPTNHLDIESIQWLEDFLISNGKAVIVISHDRKFVDNITTRTIEVTMGRIYDYKVNYSKYLELRKERREQQQKAYDDQQKFIAETKEFIERFKGTYSKTLQVQSRVKMLEKLELLEVDEEDTSALRLKFPPSPRSGNYPVIMEGVGKSYGDHVVFKNANLTIERGDKVAFVGKNGEGKSTLVKCIMKEIEHEGTLTIGHNVQIGYFAQNQASLLDENLTVFQTIDDVAKGEIRNKIRDLLGAFMFGGPEESMKKVKVLSGGERTRLAMIKLLLEPVNLLILDEPTNHLDMKTKDILKQALLDFDGTLILVSHDRDFLDGLVSKVYEFGNKQVKEHLSGIYEFLEKKKMDSLRELER